MLIGKAKYAVYNSEMFTRPLFAKTATGEQISVDSVYDTTYPVAVTIAKISAFAVYSLAAYSGAKIELNYTVPKQFKIKTVTQLFEDLKSAKDSNVPLSLISSIELDIAGRIFADDIRGFERFKILRNLRPFNGKSTQEVIYMLSSQLVSDLTKATYLNFDEIIKELETEHEGFYFYLEQKQLDLIQSKAKLILENDQGSEGNQ